MNAKERFAARQSAKAETETTETEAAVEYSPTQEIAIAEKADATDRSRAKANGTYGAIKAWFYAPQDVMDGLEDGELVEFTFDEADSMKQRKGTGHFAYEFVIGDSANKAEQILAVITVPEDVEVDAVNLKF